MRYFAFITRDDNGRYVGMLPDFPGRPARAGTLKGLTGAVRRAVRAAERDAGLPPPTTQPDLPRLPCQLDGFWMQFDLAPLVTDAAIAAVDAAAAEAAE